MSSVSPVIEASGWRGPVVSERARAWLVGFALLAWFSATAWLRPLALPDEGRYAGVAWEMLRSGQWAVPTLDGLPYFHKPPLYYWMAAAAMRVMGPHEFAARVPSILAAVAAGMALYAFLRRWSGQRQAGWALALLATQPFFFGAAQYANLDMLVAACITLTILACAHAALLEAQARPYRAWLAAGYAMAGLGFLAKGLIGMVLPALVLLAWLIVARRARTIARLLWWPGLALMLAIALPWCLAMQDRHEGFFDYFIVHHHFQRFAEGGFNNREPLWFYPAAILLLTLPSSLLLPWTLRAPSQDVGAARPVRLLMVCWALVVPAFFSLPESKLVGYVVPALPAFAALLGGALVDRAALGPALRRGLLALGAAACMGIVVGVALAPRHSSRQLGEVLQASRRTGEPVVFLGRYPFDLPLYARLETDPVVIGAWTAQETSRDDWRKELYDAGRFAPALASRRLVAADDARRIACAAATSWWVGSAEDLRSAGLQPAAVAVADSGELQLWKLSAQRAQCAAAPAP